MLTHEDVEEILRLLDATPVDELELETERFKLTLRRSPGGRGWTQQHETRGTPDVLAPTPVDWAPAGGSSAQAGGAASAPAAPAPAGAHEIRAPLLGTFYRAPKPGTAPFVGLGSRVRADTVVAIIETMKLMNSVYAGAEGEVIEICVEDGSAVDQQQVLMRLAPA